MAHKKSLWCLIKTTHNVLEKVYIKCWTSSKQIHSFVRAVEVCMQQFLLIFLFILLWLSFFFMHEVLLPRHTHSCSLILQSLCAFTFEYFFHKFSCLFICTLVCYVAELFVLSFSSSAYNTVWITVLHAHWIPVVHSVTIFYMIFGWGIH